MRKFIIASAALALTAGVAFADTIADSDPWARGLRYVRVVVSLLSEKPHAQVDSLLRKSEPNRQMSELSGNKL
jgi:hypothetical protein